MVKVNKTALTTAELTKAVEEWLRKHRPDVLGPPGRPVRGTIDITVHEHGCRVRVEFEDGEA